MNSSNYSFPVSPGRYVAISGNFPLTQNEWNKMLEILALFHDGLVCEGRTSS